MDYCVGIPVRNEETTIQSTIQRILSQEEEPNRIYICLNGNTDSTQRKVEELGNDKIQILNSEPGKPNAWNKITHQARRDGFESAIFTDGDVKMHTPKTSQTLLFALSNGVELAGGNFYRLQPKVTTWHSERCDMKEKYGTYTNFRRKTPGGLYGINLESINTRLAQFNGEIPRNVIREDLFLSLIYNLDPSSFVSTQAYVEVPPITSFKDWINMTKRQSRGLVQILEEFPQIIPEDWDFPEMEVKGNDRYSIIRKGLIQRALNEKPTSYSNLWEETTTTKVA